MIVYISGPITGVQDYKENFSAAEEMLKSKGFTVINPVTIGDNLAKAIKREPTYSEYMKADLSALLTCNLIYMLPGWEKSLGAQFEFRTATICGINEIQGEIQ